MAEQIPDSKKFIPFFKALPEVNFDVLPIVKDLDLAPKSMLFECVIMFNMRPYEFLQFITLFLPIVNSCFHK
ncbi:hypothetical protein R5R35_001282 [Gryllus longicercus]|uniref:Uncharacterized protein n=1 Tax=Gryllus longicercus TaxID=2509291 RepID=A0AAN9VN76_9ORTH